MSLVPSSHPRFAWFRTGLFGGAGRGGPSASSRSAECSPRWPAERFFSQGATETSRWFSQVAKMTPGNVLPGGTQGTPAQDALQKKDSQEKARAAEEAHKSYTPPIPSSTAFNGPPPAEVGMGESPATDLPAAKPMPPPPAIVPPAPPVFTPPERRGARASPRRGRIDGARVTKIAAINVEGDETAEEAKGAYERRQKAIGDLLDGWNARPPQTTVVIEPAALKPGADDPPALGNRVGVKGAEGAVTGERVLVPAGRGVYAHTVLAVDFGHQRADRARGRHRADLRRPADRDVFEVGPRPARRQGRDGRASRQALEANGIVIAPDSMETAVATSIDQHYVERFVLPAAAAFVSGLGQAVALSNSTTTTSPLGHDADFGPLEPSSRRRWWRAGRRRLRSATP